MIRRVEQASNLQVGTGFFGRRICKMVTGWDERGATDGSLVLRKFGVCRRFTRKYSVLKRPRSAEAERSRSPYALREGYLARLNAKFIVLPSPAVGVALASFSSSAVSAVMTRFWGTES